MLVIVIKIDKKGELFTFGGGTERGTAGHVLWENHQSQWSVDCICQFKPENVSYWVQT